MDGLLATSYEGPRDQEVVTAVLLLTFAAIWFRTTLTKAVVEGVVVPTGRALLQRMPPPGPAPSPAG